MHQFPIRILITGTPAVGKTTFSKYLQRITKYRLVNMSDLIEKKCLYSSKNTDYDSLEYSPKKVMSYLKRKISQKKSYIFDTHDPETVSFLSFDLIIVLTADLSVLGDRYKERGYNEVKIEENIEVEIMEVVYNEAICFLCEEEASQTDSKIESQKPLSKLLKISSTNGKLPKSPEEIYKEILESEIGKRILTNEK
ncbi:adenylate kinase [Nematocida sp. LUAm3]|nr:adenylate kinase [Nematocida sp. LUAm3]KAI5176407.1 adenylate kinase [Nematocida sp. LUAm2]KAI5179304.1 adenylate kinase [Nematocida sp. LUAm1]